MVKNSVMIDLNDPRALKIADVLSNKTARKVLNLLSDKELSESDISKKLDLPANTINYNMKNLVSAGLVVKSRKFFWSVKGKKIVFYRIANKQIVISPKSLSKGIIPIALISLGVAFVIRALTLPETNNPGGNIAMFAQKSGTMLSANQSSVFMHGWAWFLIGAWFALVLLFVWSLWRRNEKL